MDPRFGTLCHIALNRPNIVLKMSSKAGMVYFIIAKSAGGSTLWTDFKYIFFKKICKKLCAVCSEIPFGEGSCRAETSQIDLQLGSIHCFLYDTTFYWKKIGADFDMLGFKYCK